MTKITYLGISSVVGCVKVAFGPFHAVMWCYGGRGGGLNCLK